MRLLPERLAVTPIAPAQGPRQLLRPLVRQSLRGRRVHARLLLDSHHHHAPARDESTAAVVVHALGRRTGQVAMADVQGLVGIGKHQMDLRDGAAGGRRCMLPPSPHSPGPGAAQPDMAARRAARSVHGCAAPSSPSPPWGRYLACHETAEFAGWKPTPLSAPPRADQSATETIHSLLQCVPAWRWWTRHGHLWQQPSGSISQAPSLRYIPPGSISPYSAGPPK